MYTHLKHIVLIHIYVYVLLSIFFHLNQQKGTINLLDACLNSISFILVIIVRMRMISALAASLY